MAILQEVKQLGQQIWLDNLSRSLVRSGTLAKLQQSGVSGVTSNPAIFRQALAGDALYTAEIAQLKQQPLSAKARYETLAVADVQAACDGININLTLLFSRAQTVRAYQAYQQGLAQRAGQAAPQLVASFFISRIDTALDPQLPPQLQGKTALALAQAAYRDWQQFFSQPSSAVPTARLLWASTGVKNPAYPDTLYVDNLIAPHTVNTLPDAVLQAFTDHGRAADALSRPAVPAQPILDEVAALGIDLEALAAKLQQDGLAQFEQAFAQMLAPLAD